MAKINVIAQKKKNIALCEVCLELGVEKEAEELHHKDGNHKNNDPKNHQMLCTLCHAKIHNIEPRICELKRLVLLHNRTQKARCAIDNQIRGYSRIELIVPEFMHELSKALVIKEKDYEKQIKGMLEENHSKSEAHKPTVYPTYSFLKSIKGISHLLSAKIISYVDLSRSPTVASLWAYAGQSPDSKRKKGKKANWNPELKKICFQIGDSFIKQRTPKYREIYDKEKEKQTKLLEGTRIRLKTMESVSPQDSNSEGDHSEHVTLDKIVPSVPSSKMHAHRRASRKAVKEFLKDYWVNAKSIGGTNAIS